MDTTKGKPIDLQIGFPKFQIYFVKAAPSQLTPSASTHRKYDWEPTTLSADDTLTPQPYRAGPFVQVHTPDSQSSAHMYESLQ